MNALSKLIALTFVMSASSLAIAASDTTTPPAQGQMKAQMKAQMQQHVKETDTNGDGNISKAEFMASCEKRFAKMDANGDGQITPEERQQIKANMKQKGQGQMGGQNVEQ